MKTVLALITFVAMSAQANQPVSNKAVNSDSTTPAQEQSHSEQGVVKQKKASGEKVESSKEMKKETQSSEKKQ